MNDQHAQQDTNAALAALAATGNSFALGQLWEINKGLLHRLFWQWYAKNQPIADAAGLTFEDFEQEGFFVVERCAKAYDPDKGSFSTLLGFYVQSQINSMTCGEHSRTVEDESGRRITIAADPLNRCQSLDQHVDESDEGSATLGDLTADPAAAQAFESVDDDLYTQELHAALEEALHKLTAQQEEVIRRRYYAGQTLQEAGEQIGLSHNRVRQIEVSAFRKLSGLSSLQRWHDEIISTRAWQGTGYGAWKSGGSVEEKTIEWIERELDRRRQRAQEQELEAQKALEQWKQAREMCVK